MAYANRTTPEPIRNSVADKMMVRDRPFRTTSGLVKMAPLAPRKTSQSAAAASTSSQQEKAVSPKAEVKAPASGVLELKTESGTPSAPPLTTKPSMSSTAEGTWLYPGVAAILERRVPAQAATEAEQEWLRNTVARTRAALQQFQLNSKLVGEPRLTPNAAIIRLQGAANMTVEQVQKRRSEFLTTHGLDLISVRGEPGVVALSIARPSRQVLHTLDVWKRWTPDGK